MNSLTERLHGFLARHNVLTLAYVDEAGPGACALWFAADARLRCYFLSSLTTRHGAALRAGGKVAFTVQKDEQPWQAIQGVQGQGHCTPVPAREREAAWQLYAARFPFVLQQFPDLEAALARTLLWHIEPFWLRLVDNTQGFGHREEWQPDEGGR